MPSVGDWCDAVEAEMARWGIDASRGGNMFVVTEEQEALDAIRARFPAARFVEKERFANFRHGVSLPLQRLPGTPPFENNRLYLLDLAVLSRCDYLIGAMNSGMMMALNMNGNAYKGVRILDTGVN